MTNFLFVYHGGVKPETKEEGEAIMAAWGAWINGIRDILVDPGNPVKESSTVDGKGVHDHGGSNPISGYTAIKAENKDAALKIAQSCPHISMAGGSVEVAEIMQLNM